MSRTGRVRRGASNSTEEIASLAAYSWPNKALWRVDEELKIFNLINDPIERDVRETT